MKKIILPLVFLPLHFVLAQSAAENVVVTPHGFYSRALKQSLKDAYIEGSPYTTGKDFSKVIIPSYSKNVQPLRYNAYEDEMEFSQNNEVYFANKEDGLEITFPELKKTYICLTYRLDDNRKQGYLVLLQKGPKYSLLKREKVELLKGEKSPNAYTKDANDYYAKEKDAYIISKDNNYYKIPKNTSDLTKIPSGNQKGLLDFAKANKINLSKEADLIKLVDYLNAN